MADGGGWHQTPVSDSPWTLSVLGSSLKVILAFLCALLLPVVESTSVVLLV